MCLYYPPQTLFWVAFKSLVAWLEFLLKLMISMKSHEKLLLWNQGAWNNFQEPFLLNIANSSFHFASKAHLIQGINVLLLDWNAISRSQFISYCYCMVGKFFCPYYHQWFWATVYACPKCVFPFLKLWFYNLGKSERILEQLQIFDQFTFGLVFERSAIDFSQSHLSCMSLWKHCGCVYIFLKILSLLLSL